MVNDKGFCGEHNITEDSGTTVSVFSYGNQVIYPTITFKGNSRTVQSEYYSDSNCTTKTEVSNSFQSVRNISDRERIIEFGWERSD